MVEVVVSRLTCLMFGLTLYGCVYTSDVSLIEAEDAAFPFAAITVGDGVDGKNLASSTTLVRRGDTYRAIDLDEESPVGYRFLSIGADHYIAQIAPLDPTASNFKDATYTIVKFDFAEGTWGYFDPILPEGDPPAGLRRCGTGMSQRICVDNLRALVNLARQSLPRQRPESPGRILWTSLHSPNLADGLRAFERHDFPEALTILRPLAADGVAEAQLTLGNAYYSMDPPADEKAFKLFSLAASDGHARAQNNLGVMYESGRGVSKNVQKAATWYQAAADQGNEQAKENLNDLWDSPPVSWSEGLHLPHSHRWLQLASRASLRQAISFADAYAAQKPRVVASENKWFAVVLGPFPATDIDRVRDLYHGPPLPDDARLSQGTKYVVTLWAKGHEQVELAGQEALRRVCSYALDNFRMDWDNRERYAESVASAQLWGLSIDDCRASLGLLPAAATLEATLREAEAAYKRGDYAGALQLWRPLAEQQNARAQFWVGFLHFKGEGVVQDYLQAAMWFRRAASQSDAEAQFVLGQMYANAYGVARDNIEAMRWYRAAAAQGHPAARARIQELERLAKEQSQPKPAENAPVVLPVLEDSPEAPTAISNGGIRVRVSRCREIPECHYSGEADWVEVAGDFAEGDERVFRQALLMVESPAVFVSLNSAGGNLWAGLEIGRTIWTNEYMTVVTADVSCASSCAYAWLAGRPRFAATNAKIGFHAAWKGSEDNAEGSTPGSALIGGYLNGLGILSVAIYEMNLPGPDDEMMWLTAERAREFSILVEEWSK